MRLYAIKWFWHPLVMDMCCYVSLARRSVEYFASPYAQFHAIFLSFREIHLLIVINYSPFRIVQITDFWEYLHEYLKENKTDVFVKHKCPRQQQTPKMAFLYKGQGHKVIDLGVTWKGFISWVCMPHMKSLSLTVWKLWPRLKFFTTESQTDR